MLKFDVLVVGAGLAGSTIAERLASQLGWRILLVDKRSHVGGNTFDYYDDSGILVQKYGPHIFHTQDRATWNYLSKFTRWNKYQHRVLANLDGKNFCFPITLVTLEQLFGTRFTPRKASEFFERNRIHLSNIRTAKDVIVSQVGEELYSLFFKNYTKKQWGVYPEKLSPELTRRIPVRLNRDTRYFTDRWQGIPEHGFFRLFENMLGNDKIHVMLKTDYKDIIGKLCFKIIIYTGPIDYYFGYTHGRLPYRSLRFKFNTLPVRQFQEAAVINYPNTRRYTRITEFKHFYLQEHPKTTICYEYQCDDGDPYYPIPSVECLETYSRYKAEADRLKNIFFIGRLAEYKYYNMDQVVARALGLFNEIAGKHS